MWPESISGWNDDDEGQVRIRPAFLRCIEHTWLDFLLWLRKKQINRSQRADLYMLFIYFSYLQSYTSKKLQLHFLDLLINDL